MNVLARRRVVLWMAKFRKVSMDFWVNPIHSEEMTPDDRHFYLYLLTNQQTKQIGIYKTTIKQIAFDMGYTVEFIQDLMERFIQLHQLVRYNSKTRELAIKNWADYNFDRAGKPMMDCIFSELKEVQDISLIQYVAEAIHKPEFRLLYDSFCNKEVSHHEENNTYQAPVCEEKDEAFTTRQTIRGQEEEKEKEKEEEKEKEKQQEVFQPLQEDHLNNVHHLQDKQKMKDVKDIIEFWDNNGFGFSNVNAKEQLLSWLDDSRFLQPKAVILKALTIACTNNKRRLSYVLGILKNWENESLLTVEEIDSYQENQKPAANNWKTTKPVPSGRDIPSGFDQDITAGEDW